MKLRAPATVLACMAIAACTPAPDAPPAEPPTELMAVDTPPPAYPEALACDLRLEQAAQATIKDGIAHCESVRDYVSRDLLQKILDDTEEHIDYLETQIGLIEQLGVQNYLQLQVGDGQCSAH